MSNTTLDERVRNCILEMMADDPPSPDWDAVVSAAARLTLPEATRTCLLRVRGRVIRRGRVVALAAVVLVAVGATIPQLDWVSAQFDRFGASSTVDMQGVPIVATLEQHDGSALQIAEKTFAAGGSTPAMRCVAAGPPQPADPVSAPADPLSFGGFASCTHLDVIAFRSEWKDDGSASVLARRPDDAAALELRNGGEKWLPASSDGRWTIFWLPSGAVAPGAHFDLVAVDASGAAIATERVH